jgi:hypothetical protein
VFSVVVIVIIAMVAYCSLVDRALRWGFSSISLILVIIVLDFFFGKLIKKIEKK